MPEQQRPDPYASSGKNSGSVFNLDLSSLDSIVLPDAAPMLDRPTSLGMKDDTSTDIPVVSAPGKPIEKSEPLPFFVNKDGTIDTVNLRATLIQSKNRPGEKFVPGKNETISSEVAYEIIAWVTGVKKAPSQSAEQFLAANEESGLICRLYREPLTPFQAALNSGFAQMGRAISSTPLPGTDATLESLIKMDPVGACHRMINTISPYDGAGMAKALLMMRDICQSE